MRRRSRGREVDEKKRWLLIRSRLCRFHSLCSLCSLTSARGPCRRGACRRRRRPRPFSSFEGRGTEEKENEKEGRIRKPNKTVEKITQKTFTTSLFSLSFLSLSLPPSRARDPSRSQAGNELPPLSSPFQRRGRANFCPITFPSSVKPPVQVRPRHPLQRDNKGRRPQGQPFLRGHPPDVLEGGRHGLVEPLAFFVGVGERKSFGKARRKGGGEKGGGGG